MSDVARSYEVQQQIADLEAQLEAERLALRKSEELSHIFLQLTTDYAYIYQIKRDGSIIREWISDAFQRITGFMQEELDTRGWEQLQHPDDQPLVQKRLQAVFEGQKDVQEWRVITRNGQVRWLRDTCLPVRDEQQQDSVRIYGVAQDITERKQAEQQLLQQTQRLEATFEAMVDALTIYDHEGRLVQVNSSARDLFAFAERANIRTQELINRIQHLNVRDEQGQPLPVESWPQSRVLRGEVLKGSNAMEIQLTTVDGRDIALNVTGAPIRDAQGRQLGAVLINHDVTERRRQEQRTHQALDTLLRMAEALVQGPPPSEPDSATAIAHRHETARQLIILTSELLGCKTASIISVTPETERLLPVATIGLAPEIEQQFWKNVPGMSLPDYLNATERGKLQHGEPIIFSLANIPSPQALTYGVQVVMAAPMRLGDQLIGILSIDYLTAEHRYPLEEEMTLLSAIGKLAALVLEREHLLAESALAQAREMASQQARQQMDEFLSMTSHELRTPLTTIKASLQLSQRQLKQLKETEPGEEIVERIESLLARAERQMVVESRLINDLLDVSRIQENKLDMLLQPCNLVTIVRQVVADQIAIAGKRTIQTVLPEEESVLVQVDADRIGQVLSNYLANAIKYSGLDKPIEVRLEVSETSARVSVRDEGPGIEPAEQQRIWERFYQASSSAHSGSKGLGLGLYICQSIIKQHSGKVGIESTPGIGSTFWFTLPLVDTAYN